MNGRVYDYNLGRFLSVDPFIQSPTNSQSMNPYSYIMNNPLSGTDPTGYIADIEEKTEEPPKPKEPPKEKFKPKKRELWGGSRLHNPHKSNGSGSSGGSAPIVDFGGNNGNSGDNGTNQNGIGSEFIGAVKRIGQQILASQAESFWGNVGAENATEIGIASGENIFPINNSAEQAGADIVDSSPALGIVIVAGQAIVTRGRSLDPNDLLRSHSISGNRSSKRVDELSQNMRNEGFVGDGIDVVDNKGQLIIIDGHHRAAAARRTNTRVNVNVVTDIKNHPSNFNDINDVIKSAETVGLDQLKPRKR